ncbi:hypothetical protein HDU91_007202 [Kappamyces sp. JEL0680]|nr:hypothetical protein HDU91_007202 [Kappamyces sp. JEL0680]
MTVLETTVPSSILGLLQGLTMGVTFLGLVANTLIIAGIWRSKGIRSMADTALNLNLSASDFMLCLTWLGTQGYMIVSGSTLYDMAAFCKLEGLIIYLFLASSVFTLIAIAGFHFLTVVLEKGLASSLQVFLVLGAIWTASIIGTLFGYGVFVPNTYVVQPSGLYCLNNFVDQSPFPRAFNLGIVGVLFGTPLILVGVYFMIWKKLHKHRLFVAPRTTTASNSGGTETLNVNKMIIRRAISLTSSFAAVYYFENTIFMWQILTGEKVSWQFDAIGAAVVSLSTIVNPLLFFWLDIRARKAILAIFGLQMASDDSKRTSSYTNKS